MAEGEIGAAAKGFGVGGDGFVAGGGGDREQGVDRQLGGEVASLLKVGEPEGGFGVRFYMDELSPRKAG